ncbi:hypothetical protein Tco_0195423 [Tanacetum coccineum]
MLLAGPFEQMSSLGSGVGYLSGKGPTAIFRVLRYASVLPRITSLKCVLTQEHLDAICAKYFVPEEVHPQLPSSDAIMHERPIGESVLTHFRIPFSQLSVFGSAKVDEYMWFLLMRPGRFCWFSGSNIVKDRAPGPSEYNVEHINTLIAQASPDGFECFYPVSAGSLHVGTEIPRPKRSKKKRVTRESERMPAASHPPKRLRADYGKLTRTGCSSSFLLLYPFITSSVVNPASPFGGRCGDRTDSVTGPSLRTIGAYIICGSELILSLSDQLYTSACYVGKVYECAASVQFLGSSSSSEEDEDWTTAIGAGLGGKSMFRVVRADQEDIVRGMAAMSNLFTEYKVSAARNLGLCPTGEDSSQTILYSAQVSGLEATENSLRGEVASTKEHNILLEQECDSLKLKVTGLESTIAEKDHELS